LIGGDGPQPILQLIEALPKNARFSTPGIFAAHGPKPSASNFVIDSAINRSAILSMTGFGIHGMLTKSF
jgi:hypothetical protein